MNELPPNNAKHALGQTTCPFKPVFRELTQKLDGVEGSACEAIVIDEISTY